MVTIKIRAAWRIITSKSFSIVTVQKSGVKYQNNIKTDLASAMTLVAALNRSTAAVTKAVEDQAAEAGELHRAEALKQAIERIN